MDMRSLKHDDTSKELISEIVKYLHKKYNLTVQELCDLAQLIISDYQREVFLCFPCEYFSADWLNMAVGDLIGDMEKSCDTAGKALLWLENQNLCLMLESL